MPPSLALLIWLALLLGLLCFDPAKEGGTSPALWVPIIWMFIIGSRLPSQWLGFQVVGQQAQALEQGNPLDRAIWSVLILLAISILVSRSFKWIEFFTCNSALTALISFALLSVMWSDFPFVAFKDWSRDFGSYVAILVVLSDPRPLEAVRTLLRRLAYLWLPLSIVLIKYYRNLGVQYDGWTGDVMSVGVTTAKNSLGILCLVSGIFFFWDTVTRWADCKDQRTKRIIVVNLAFIAMTLWLLHLAHSATSGVCLALACLVILAAHSKGGKRHPGFLKVIVPASFFLYLMLTLGFGMSGKLNEMVGRQANFTDRTLIWKSLLGMHTNPLIGTGYNSFWLGPRLEWIWRQPGVGRINEAHNGYLGIYLNLGLIGLLLLIGFLISGYRTVCKRLEPFSAFGSFSLAMWTIFLFQNVTEESTRNSVIWIMFVLVALAVPEHAEDRALSAASIDANALKQLPVHSKWQLTGSYLSRFASAEISSRSSRSNPPANRWSKLVENTGLRLRSRLVSGVDVEPFSGHVATRPERDE